MTEQQIEELIQKYAEGTAREEEIQKLIDWYRNSPDEVHWTSPDPVEKQTVYNRMLNRMKKEIRVEPGRVLSFPWSKMVAILVLFLGIAALLVYLRPFSPAYIAVANPSGKVQTIQLPDSSFVSLNANSTLRYSKNFNRNRSLELSGEGFFNVTHDPSYPFIVKAGELETTVLGTAFNIKAYPSMPKTVISVINGSVKVDHEEKELGMLSPSGQLQYDKSRETASLVTIDSNSVIGWRRGQLQFDGETFSEIAGSIENWYGVKIVLTNPGMGACRFYMSFDNTIALDKLLQAMSIITEMKYSINNNTNTITISGKECR
ncbi:MAG TPA: FecR domain-containing protein [Chitinophagaceae bacterium]|nr:FecR domain-containing protein [Chitinophagaceae bacterium]